MPARFRASHGSLTIAVLLVLLGSGALADEATVTRPKKIAGERPVYPEMARRTGVLEGLLLQEKAKVTRDPSERQSLFDEAQELLDRSLATQDTGKAPGHSK